MVEKSNILYIHDFIPLTEVEGPGKRACIWVQGCSIRCEGCMVPHTWERNAGRPVFIDDLFDQLSSNQEIEGLTVLGGEPMDQAEVLLPLLTKVKEINLSIMVFTGYRLEQLTGNTQKQIIALCDLLIDGPYVKALTDFSRPWVGSKNQQIHFLTDRYKYLENQLSTANFPIEVRIAANGEIKINGMLSDTLLEALQREFERI
jgi:anaerobic ribonucleoside-triphosphate reductase activating protein